MAIPSCAAPYCRRSEDGSAAVRAAVPRASCRVIYGGETPRGPSAGTPALLYVAPGALCYLLALIVQVLLGDIIFRHFAGGDFRNAGVIGIFHPLNDLGFKSITLFHQLFYAFRISAFDIRDVLEVACLPC